MTLFRPEVFQAKKNRWTGQIVLVRPFSLQFLTFFAVSLAAILVAFLIFGSYTNKTTVTGQLLPTTGVVRVYSQDMGVIAHQHVMNGDFVKKGDVLFTLSTSRNDNNGSIQARLLAEAELKKSLSEQEIIMKKRVHAAEKTAQENTVHRFQNQMQHVRNQIIMQEKRIAISEKMLEKQRYLAKMDAISELEKNSYEIALLELKAGLAAYQREADNLAREITVQQSNLKNLPEQQATEISQLERAVSVYQQEILDYQQRNEQTIRATISGYVSSINTEIGQQVDTNKLLMSIVPKESELLANLYVPSRAIGFVKPNDKVILRYQACPYQKFGHAEGHVISIAQTALGAQEWTNLGNIFTQTAQVNEPVYLIKVKLDNQHIRIYGTEKKLQIGMILEADILHENKRLYEWILDPLYQVMGKIS
ncbi:TPA: HlyD family secretion protein [Neisseria meningitidis]